MADHASAPSPAGPLLTTYIAAAMRHATYEIFEEDGTFYGEIPSCPGAWANEKTLERCREVLQEVLEEWMILGLRFKDEMPVIDGFDINPKREEEETSTTPP